MKMAGQQTRDSVYQELCHEIAGSHKCVYEKYSMGTAGAAAIVVNPDHNPNISFSEPIVHVKKEICNLQWI